MPNLTTPLVGGSYRSRQIVAALFVEAMDDAEAGAHLPCPTLVNTTLSVLNRADSNIRELKRHHPSVIRACVRFLFAPRTAGERRRLFEAGSLRCTCAPAARTRLRDLHRPERLGISQMPVGPNLEHILASLVRMLWPAIQDSESELRSPVKRANLSGSRCPTGEADVIPHGLEDTLSNFCGWAEVSHQVSLLTIAGQLYHIVAQYTQPRLLYTILIPRIIIPLVGHVVTYWHDSSGDDLPRIAMILEGLGQANHLLRHLGHISRAQATILMRRSNFDGPAFIELCVRAIEALIEMRAVCRSRQQQALLYQCSNSLDCFASIAARYHRYLDLSLDDPQYLRVILPHRDELHDEFTTGVTWDLSTFGRWLFKPRVCANSGCARTRRVGGGTLAACKGCAHVFYCSRGCQKTAWRSVRAPHRDVCGILEVAMRHMEGRVQDTHGKVVPFDGYADAFMEVDGDEAGLTQLVRYFAEIYSR